MLLEIMLNPWTCLVSAFMLTFAWWHTIRSHDLIALRDEPYGGIFKLIKEHRMELVRVPLDILALYVLFTLLIAHYVGVDLETMSKLPNIENALQLAFGVGVLEAIKGLVDTYCKVMDVEP